MINKLHKNLNRIFVLFTSSLLLLLVAFVVIFNMKQMKLKVQNSFNTLFYTVLSKLQTDDTTISNDWLSSLERENNLSIIIDDNGNYISTSNVVSDNLLAMIEQMRDYAEEEDLTLTSISIFSDPGTTETYTLNSADGTSYFGCASIMASKNGYRTLYIFQKRPPLTTITEILFYIFICIFGIGCIYLLSHYLIRKAMAPVHHSQEQQNQFIAAASHELRSPLTVIRTNNSDCKSLEDISKREVIEKECVRMGRLISDLLALSNMDAHNYSCKMEEVDCDSLLLEVYDAFMPAAEEKGLSIEMRLPDDELPKVKGDYERIKQIFSILLDNAITYSPSQTAIIIEGNVHKNNLELKVVDHGPGIPDEVKEKVFHRFYRADAARRDKEHFGLGLSIAQKLAELQNSRLLLVDTPGGGATFVLEFPLY